VKRLGKGISLMDGAAPPVQSNPASPKSTVIAGSMDFHRGVFLRAARRVARTKAKAKACFASAITRSHPPTTLAQKELEFESRKLKNLWKLFYEFRIDFVRPVESDRVSRRACLLWKAKHHRNSPGALVRFFKKHPNIAVWSVWVERVIHETQLRSGKNQSPRVDLLRECLRILVDAWINWERAKMLDEPTGNS
jgi:hypothetical protein